MKFSEEGEDYNRKCKSLIEQIKIILTSVHDECVEQVHLRLLKQILVFRQQLDHLLVVY